MDSSEFVSVGRTLRHAAHYDLYLTGFDCPVSPSSCRSRGNGPVPRCRKANGMRRPRILLADDSAAVRTQVSRALSDAGYEVAQATDGLAALQLAATEPPALAILDIEMPSMDGYAVCQEIRQMGSPWSEIPIVFLTASRSRALEMLGTQLGAYVQKPISPDALLKVVHSLVARREANESEMSETQQCVLS